MSSALGDTEYNTMFNPQEDYRGKKTFTGKEQNQDHTYFLRQPMIKWHMAMARSRESKLLLEERGHNLCFKEWAGDVNQEKSGKLPKNGIVGTKAEKKEWPRLVSAKE